MLVDRDKDLEMVAEIATAKELITDEMAKSIVGQKKVIEGLLIALFAKGHCLLEGVPGLAKTAMVRSLSEVMDLSFRRIQFTPDLMPADITGTEIIQEDPPRSASLEDIAIPKAESQCQLEPLS